MHRMQMILIQTKAKNKFNQYKYLLEEDLHFI